MTLKGLLVSVAVLSFASSICAANPCDGYLRRKADGSLVGHSRIEHLFGQTVRLHDVSADVTESVSHHAPDLKVIRLDDVFEEARVYLGFGRPNAYLVIPRADGTSERFAAKSLKRGPSLLEPAKGRAQSGVFFVFKNLSPEVVDSIYESAQKHVGGRNVTCVNANCEVLSDAGFTSGGRSLNEFYLPVTLMESLMANGLEVNGERVDFDIVRTTPSQLERYGLSVLKAQYMTLCRHAERACADSAREGNRFSAFILRLRDGTRKALGAMLIRSNEAPPTPDAAAVNLPASDTHASDLQVRVSQASHIGRLFRMMWHPHSLFEVIQQRVDINRYLPQALKAFPQAKPSMATRLKQYFLFSRPVVAFLRAQLASQYVQFDEQSEKDVYDKIRTHTEAAPNKYNYIMTGEAVTIMRLNVRHRFVDWLLSKHVLMSGYSDDLRLSGEVWKDAAGVVWLNGCSGTYRPTSEQVSAGVSYLRAIFPNVDVRVDPAPCP